MPDAGYAHDAQTREARLGKVGCEDGEDSSSPIKAPCNLHDPSRLARRRLQSFKSDEILDVSGRLSTASSVDHITAHSGLGQCDLSVRCTDGRGALVQVPWNATVWHVKLLVWDKFPDIAPEDQVLVMNSQHLVNGRAISDYAGDLSSGGVVHLARESVGVGKWLGTLLAGMVPKWGEQGVGEALSGAFSAESDDESGLLMHTVSFGSGSRAAPEEHSWSVWESYA